MLPKGIQDESCKTGEAHLRALKPEPCGQKVKPGGSPRTGCRSAVTVRSKKWPVLSAPYTHFQSQRDCVLQPRVASLRATLGKRPRSDHNPNGVAPDRPRL